MEVKREEILEKYREAIISDNKIYIKLTVSNGKVRFDSTDNTELAINQDLFTKKNVTFPEVIKILKDRYDMNVID